MKAVNQCIGRSVRHAAPLGGRRDGGVRSCGIRRKGSIVFQLFQLVVRHLFLVANLVTTSKAPVTTSVALVTTSFLPLDFQDH